MSLTVFADMLLLMLANVGDKLVSKHLNLFNICVLCQFSSQ